MFQAHLTCAKIALECRLHYAALPHLQSALAMVPNTSREWSKVMTAIRFTKKAIKARELANA
jgi:hypothetical protein